MQYEAPKSCYESLVKQTLKREQRYDHVLPPEDQMPSHMEWPPMNNSCPSDQEVRQAVKKRGNGRRSGASKMWTGDLKIWLAGAENKDWARVKGVEIRTPGGAVESDRDDVGLDNLGYQSPQFATQVLC